MHACLSGEGRVGSGVVPTADCIRGIGFDATCSLAVLDGATDEPIAVTDPSGPREQPPEEAGGSDPVRNVILWLDHRATAETATVNATSHPLLRFVGGRMSVEMEVPKALWLKRHLSPEDWKRCRLYDLADALTHLATGNEARSFCSAVCKQGYVPVGIDGSVKGWNDEFLRAVGLEDLSEEAYKKIGGVDGVVSPFS